MVVRLEGGVFSLRGCFFLHAFLTKEITLRGEFCRGEEFTRMWGSCYTNEFLDSHLLKNKDKSKKVINLVDDLLVGEIFGGGKV